MRMRDGFAVAALATGSTAALEAPAYGELLQGSDTELASSLFENHHSGVSEFAGPIATAASVEGQNGNNIVCDGVYTKKKLVKLAEGAGDSCGNTDIDEAWAVLGITPQLAKTAKKGTVCSSEGTISEGRGLSPGVDKLVKLGHSKIYTRPLSAWGETCYPAWVMQGEDGKKRAVIEDCGNGQGPHVQQPHHPEKPHHPAKKHRHHAPVFLNKALKDSTGKLFPKSEFVSDFFQFKVDCIADGVKKRRKVTLDHPHQLALRGCDVGTTAHATELHPHKGAFTNETSAHKRARIHLHGTTIGFIDIEKKPEQPTPNPTPTPEGNCNGDTTNTGGNNGSGDVNQQSGNCSPNTNCTAINSPNAVVCATPTPGETPTPTATPNMTPTPTITPNPSVTPTPTATVSEKMPSVMISQGPAEGLYLDIFYRICATGKTDPESHGFETTADGSPLSFSSKYQGDGDVLSKPYDNPDSVDPNDVCIDFEATKPHSNDTVTAMGTDKVNHLTASAVTQPFNDMEQP